MSNEDQQLEQERQEQAACAELMRSKVMSLLRQLAPTASNEALATACEEVVQSILSFGVSTEIAAISPLSKTRQDLRLIKGKFEECTRFLNAQAVPGDALDYLRWAQLSSAGQAGQGSRKKLLLELGSAIAAIDVALGELESQPAHRGKPERAVLAAELWRTLRKTLGLRVVIKSDSDIKKAKLGTTANYSQLLRLALDLAGVNPPDDLRPLMRNGRNYAAEHGLYIFTPWNGYSVLNLEKFTIEK